LESNPLRFVHNGCIDILKTSCILEKKSISGNLIYPVIMDENNDIDSKEDFDKSLDKNN